MKRLIEYGGCLLVMVAALLPSFATRHHPTCTDATLHSSITNGPPAHAPFCHAIAMADTLIVEDDDEDEAAEDSLSADTLATDSVAELPWPENLRARVDKLLESSIFRTSTVGLQIYDLTADSVLYEYNQSQLMRPASSLKMMVAVTALHRLGADYRLATKMSYSGRIDSTYLNGNIYIKGGMDPTIDNDDIARFADKISELGVDTINGDICLDLSMKDKDRLGEGWCWDDDNPVLSPLLASRKEEFGERLLSRLRRKGITVTGSCRDTDTPSATKEIYTNYTPLSTVMTRQLKRSDNLYSEAIFYNIASDYSGRRYATARQGRLAVNKLIEQLGFRPTAYYIADGSGLSLYNYVSPELEVAFLRFAYHHKDIYDNLVPCLPIAGVDGTLSKRMRNTAAQRNVKAKTGTVTGVSALAGYCTAANGHQLCFSIINMGIRHASSGRNFQDRVCQAMCK